jgi:glycerophosphoryl diester phosphodiesterase
MTKDGQLVILHDDTLDRAFNTTGRVEEMTVEELHKVTTKKTGQHLLFLNELLAYFADKPGVYLELEMKTSDHNVYPDARLKEYCRILYDMAIPEKPQSSFYVLTSFDEQALQIVKASHPDADLLLISGDPVSAEVVKRAQALGVKRIGCSIEGSSRSAVSEAQKTGFRVSVWPGHSIQDYCLALGLGADAICTDIPVAVFTWKAQHEPGASATK